MLVHNTMNIIREEPHFSLSLEMSRNVIRFIIIVHGKTWLCVYVSVCAHVYVFICDRNKLDDASAESEDGMGDQTHDVYIV